MKAINKDKMASWPNTVKAFKFKEWLHVTQYCINFN